MAVISFVESLFYPKAEIIIMNVLKLCGILIYCVVQTAMAQSVQTPTIQWQRIIATGAYSDSQVVLADTTGYALILAEKVVRLSESGDSIWTTHIPSPDSLYGQANIARQITRLPDGGFVILANNDFKWFIARLNSEGVVLWVKPFIDVENGYTSILKRTFSGLISTIDSNFVAVGYTQAGRNGTSTELYKFDNAGNLILNKVVNNNYGSKARGSTIANQLLQGSDGTYLLVGKASAPTGRLTAWAAKLDAQLSSVWQKNFDGNELNSVIESPAVAGTYIAIGSQGSNGTRTIIIGANGEMNDGFNQTNRVAGSKSFILRSDNTSCYTIVDAINENAGDLRLQKLDLQNQILSSPVWIKNLGGSSQENIKSVIATRSGGYLLVGTTKSTDGDIQGKTTNEIETWIIKLL